MNINTQLYDSIVDNNLEEVRILISRGGRIDEAVNSEGQYALWIVTSRGKTYQDMISYLFTVLKDEGQINTEENIINFDFSNGTRDYIIQAYEFADRDIKDYIYNFLLGNIDHIPTTDELASDEDIYNFLLGNIDHIPTTDQLVSNEDEDSETGTWDEDSEAETVDYNVPGTWDEDSEAETVDYNVPTDLETQDIEAPINIWNEPVRLSNILSILGFNQRLEAVFTRQITEAYETRNNIICTMGQNVFELENFENRLLNSFNEADMIGFIFPRVFTTREQILCYDREQLRLYWESKETTYKGILPYSLEEYENMKNKYLYPEYFPNEEQITPMYFMNFDQLPGTFFLRDNAALVLQSTSRLFVVVPITRNWWDINPRTVTSTYHNYENGGDPLNIIVPVNNINYQMQ